MTHNNHTTQTATETELAELTPEELLDMDATRVKLLDIHDARVKILKHIARHKTVVMDCISRNMYHTAKYNIEQCIILEDMLFKTVV